MMLRGHTGGWSLFFLAAIISGVHLQRNASSAQPAFDSKLPSEAQIDQPVLRPSETAPPIGTYMVKNPAGEPCIKATMGVEYIVIENKTTWYLNLDPSRVRTSGYCDKQAAVLSLTLLDKAASLQLTFKTEESFFYVTGLTAQVSPLPLCQRCANKTYSGSMAHKKLFAAADGQSFNCKSEILLLMSSSELRIKLVPLQIQAFNLTNGQYGQEVECWADFNRRVIPMIIGATVVTLILIAVLTYLVIRDRRRQGYERI